MKDCVGGTRWGPMRTHTMNLESAIKRVDKFIVWDTPKTLALLQRHEAGDATPSKPEAALQSLGWLSSRLGVTDPKPSLISTVAAIADRIY